MNLTDLLSADRVAVRPNGDAQPLDKMGAVHLLADLLARGAKLPPDAIERVLLEREQLQSTGIGEGVAIPHGALPELDHQVAALLTAPEGVEFEAIDGAKVNILVAVIGPKRASGEHLKTLARVSRLLRSKSFRDRLLAAPDAGSAYRLLLAEETERQ